MQLKELWMSWTARNANVHMTAREMACVIKACANAPPVGLTTIAACGYVQAHAVTTASVSTARATATRALRAPIVTRLPVLTSAASTAHVTVVSANARRVG